MILICTYNWVVFKTHKPSVAALFEKTIASSVSLMTTPSSPRVNQGPSLRTLAAAANKDGPSSSKGQIETFNDSDNSETCGTSSNKIIPAKFSI